MNLYGPPPGAGAVADGVDAPVRRAQAGVDGDAALVVGDPGGFEPEPSVTGRRPAATRRWLPSTDHRRVAGPEHDDDAVVPLLDPLDPDPGVELDPVLEERALEHRRHLGVVAGEEAGGLEDRDLGAEAAVGLRQLRPDRPAADDEEPLRPPAKDRRRSRW